MRPNFPIAVFLAVFAVSAGVGCGSSGAAGDGSHPNYEKALAGARPELADVYAEANRLLPGGVDAYEQRIAALRGYPVVVNVWASWCGPCRLEFESFQQLSARYGKRVAFLGVDSEDSEDRAQSFLRETPVPYPSFSDPDEKIAESLGGRGFPRTAFYGRDGRLLFLKQGQYSDQAALRADIERCALGPPGECESG